MTALQLIEKIKRYDYDNICLIIVHPTNIEDTATEVTILGLKNDKYYFRFDVKLDNGKYIILQYKDKFSIDKQIGEFNLFSLLYFVALCAQLKNCIV